MSPFAADVFLPAGRGILDFRLNSAPLRSVRPMYRVMATPPDMFAGGEERTTSRSDMEIDNPNSGFPDIELADNTFALAVSHRTIQFLTTEMMECEANLDEASKMAADQLFTSHVLSHDAYNTANKLVQTRIDAVIEKLKKTKWYKKHGKTAERIAAIPLMCTLKWATENDRCVLLVDETADTRCTLRNAELYQHYRLLHHPEETLCKLAASVPNGPSHSAHVLTTKTEMHWERSLTPDAARHSAIDLRNAIQGLNNVLK